MRGFRVVLAKLSFGQVTQERLESLTPPFAVFYVPDRLVRSQPVSGLEVALRCRLYWRIYLGGELSDRLASMFP